MSPLLPLPFYLSCIAVVFLAWKAWQGREEGWGIPMLTVLLTAFTWYPGDAIYNNYEEYVLTIGVETLQNAWWEVTLFFIAFGILVPVINKKVNGSLGSNSRIFQMMRDNTIDTEEFQNQVTMLTRILVPPWILLMGIALIRTNFDFIGIFAPYLGELNEPWGRDRLGGGIDALYSFAGYIQILLTALFGVTLALSKKLSTWLLTGAIYLLSSPYFFFGRTRNSMLAVILPGFLALVTLRMRGGIIIRLVVVIIAFMGIEGWMKFVIDNRDKGSIMMAVKTGGTQDEAVKSRKHLGFNMFQELGFINYFIANGTYKPNWGSRYFAEIVNPIPRVLWPGKPMIGIDYAIARGLGYGELGSKSGGVAASVSTGMIGQGVVNFGGILGPIAVAIIMAFWVAILARQDLMGNDLGHLLLYAIGLVLTFNRGRDITLLVLYPFVFGWIFLKYFGKKHRN